MKITYEDYTEFIESLTSEQAADLTIVYANRIAPKDQLRVDKATANRMASLEEVCETSRRTFVDGTVLESSTIRTNTFDGRNAVIISPE